MADYGRHVNNRNILALITVGFRDFKHTTAELVTSYVSRVPAIHKTGNIPFLHVFLPFLVFVKKKLSTKLLIILLC